ncbi:hypothetical protein MRX96_057145 [Rhipicephalus microplus]|uniref:Uncharacterized protein n=1 Tax=Rhipicephalus microplus TaxID=6941 RepID=A0A9J6EJ44_RHIMP|nr:hypothetical protein HPB51_019272 [Rhipicephalus microplus]
MNTWKPCSIYYGISPGGFVHGVKLNRKERDALRCGVDFMVGYLRPYPTCTSIGVVFFLPCCYLREGDESYLACTNDVRASIMRVEENYLQAKNRATLKKGKSPAAEDTPCPWDDIVANWNSG